MTADYAGGVGEWAAEGITMIPASLVRTPDAEWGLADTAAGLRLVVAQVPPMRPWIEAFVGERHDEGGRAVLVAELSSRNAAALRAHLPWLRPRPLGLAPSAGLGDRLGLATAGHVRAMRAAGRGLCPVFAQQSIREMSRTGRSPQDVIDASTWGMFEEGWRGGTGADADHLKTTTDIDACLAAGFTFFTIDPSAYVNTAADTAQRATVEAAVDALPWGALEDTRTALGRRFLGTTFEIDGDRIGFDEGQLLRAAMKYGAAVAHVAAMYRHLAGASRTDVDLEVSIDETDSPTSAAEHLYLARELRRLGVRWTSLAPRFVGRFEKGVDYIGDVEAFEADMARHAAIALACGPYKLSLHSGSDKFSIYPAAARQTRGLVHLKTAGTSYLEALRTIAAVDPSLFRAIADFALERYPEDRASYHVSADPARAAKPRRLPDAALPGTLDDFDLRQILHVTFGSVLTAVGADGTRRFAPRIHASLATNRHALAAGIEAHFVRHLRPFSSAVG